MMIRNRMLPYITLNFATTPTITPDSGGSPDPGSGGAGTPTPGGGGTVSAPAPINWESAPQQFRDGYSKLKADFEKLQGDYKPWQALNVKPDQVGQYQQTYQNIHTELSGIANNLGIDEREVADAIRAHGLLPVLDHLRQEAQQSQLANSGDENARWQQELDERINTGIESRLSPVLERENLRITSEANTLVENTISTLANDSFKAAGIDWNGAPPELKNFVMTGVTEVLKYDDDGMIAIKTQGKTASIQKAFQTFQSMWDAAYMARRKMEGGMPPPVRRPGQPAPPVQGKRPSLDEMLDNPDRIREAQGLPKYAT
jgi:hypothetical protein